VIDVTDYLLQMVFNFETLNTARDNVNANISV